MLCVKNTSNNIIRIERGGIIKKKILTAVLSFVLMAVLPLLSLRAVNDSIDNAEGKPQMNKVSEPSEKKDVSDISAPKKLSSDENTFIILDTSSGQKITVSDEEFCIGALAYEMPPSFETEALKAQCTACYTRFCRIRTNERQNPDKEMKGADFKADLSKGEYYLSNEILKERWGDLYDECYQKINAAVDDVFRYVMTDSDGNCIDAAYHAISGGQTENAKDIFGNEDEHLISVASPWDKLVENYQSEYEFSDEEFQKTILSKEKDADFSSGPEKVIGKVQRTPAGTVESIVIGGKSISGTDMRSLFSLRSANFSITHQDGKFRIIVLGYGHGVGMSQCGANAMAEQGADYQQILKHYYAEISLIRKSQT